MTDILWPDLMGIPNYRRYEQRLPRANIKSFQKRLVLISDTHISTENNSCFNSTMFRKGIEEINQIKNVDHIIHLGDLTHDGTYLEYQIALDLIRRINNEKFCIIPGNHDARNVGYLLFEELFGSRRFEVDHPELYILGIDSTIPDENPGLVGKVALKRSEKDLLDHEEQVKLFCFHHQTIPIPFTGRERSAIYDGGDVLEMALNSNVNVILNGHRHITNAYSCTDGDSDLIIFNCGTLSANKTRYREMFTYTILDISEKMVKFTTKKLLDDSFLERRRYISFLFNHPPPPTEDPLMTLIHFGNTHFGENLFLPDIYLRGCQQINNYNPDLIVFTGSLTANNRLREYELAKKNLTLLKKDVLILPGFKDLQKYGWDRFEEIFGKPDLIYESANLRVKALNTVDPHIAHGSVGRTRMHETCDFFKHTFDPKKNIIALNHRLIPTPRLKFEQILEDSGSVLKNFTEPRNRIHVILNGKNNVGSSLQLENTVLSFCGSFSSRNSIVKREHSFNIVRCFRNGITQVFKHHIETNKQELIGQFWQ